MRKFSPIQGEGVDDDTFKAFKKNLAFLFRPPTQRAISIKMGADEGNLSNYLKGRNAITLDFLDNFYVSLEYELRGAPGKPYTHEDKASGPKEHEAEYTRPGNTLEEDTNTIILQELAKLNAVQLEILKKLEEGQKKSPEFPEGHVQSPDTPPSPLTDTLPSDTNTPPTAA